MDTVAVDKLLKKREELLDRLAYYNDPPMFNLKNFEPHKKRTLARLHKIADTLHKELNKDKKRYAF
jgi:hypothetical protein